MDDFFYLMCPDCSSGSFSENAKGLQCDNCSAEFPISFGRPVLLRHDNSLFSKNDYQNPPVAVENKKWYRQLMPSASVNLARVKAVIRMQRLLEQSGKPRILVVGGGRQRELLEPLLNPDGLYAVVYTDIDTRADVDIFCDAHDLPFKDSSFDAVVTTAVLEHVLYPERVAAQIFRVLKTGGLLYSEMPFMQQVHEGAYDFTRYTLSGHRRLFNGFEIIDAGLVAGPGTALVWSIESFVSSFVSKRRVRALLKAVTRLCVFWLKYFDYWLARHPAAMDGASCTYLLGRRVDGQVEDAKIIEGYVGAKQMSHA